VAQEHVMQFVHDEQEEVFVGLAAFTNEIGIDHQYGPALAGHRGRWHAAGHLDSDERQERVHGVAPRRYRLQDASNELLVLSNRFCHLTSHAGNTRIAVVGVISDG
jgi:hypothetical protein